MEDYLKDFEDGKLKKHNYILAIETETWNTSNNNERYAMLYEYFGLAYLMAQRVKCPNGKWAVFQLDQYLYDDEIW